MREGFGIFRYWVKLSKKMSEAWANCFKYWWEKVHFRSLCVGRSVGWSWGNIARLERRRKQFAFNVPCNVAVEERCAVLARFGFLLRTVAGWVWREMALTRAIFDYLMEIYRPFVKSIKLSFAYLFYKNGVEILH